MPHLKQKDREATYKKLRKAAFPEEKGGPALTLEQMARIINSNGR